MLVIRKLDNHNFTLSQKLDEPQVVNIAGKDVVYEYKNKIAYYGNLHGAISGLLRHTNHNKVTVPDELKTIKPYSDESKYVAFTNVPVAVIMKLLKD